MIIKYYSLCSLMYFVNHDVRVSGTEHPNKRTITKLRFHYRVNIELITIELIINFFSVSFR